MSNSIYLKARAKINLYLDVINKREDNYHNIKSIFQKINLYDEIFITKTTTNNINLNTNIDSLNNDKNIIYKAYKVLKEKYNIGGVKVILNKKIPMQAGLGGGSSDCAGFLLGMNKLFGLNLSKKQLEEIGKKLGADVVPCLYDGAVIAEGIGDIVTPIKTDFKYYLVILKPYISCVTKEMYAVIDKQEKSVKEDTTERIIKGLQNNNAGFISDNLYNIFESVMNNKELINDLKEKLVQNGANGSLMTGSGSCVFGVFEDKNTAKKAYQKLKEEFETYICSAYNYIKNK